VSLAALPLARLRSTGLGSTSRRGEWNSPRAPHPGTSRGAVSRSALWAPLDGIGALIGSVDRLAPPYGLASGRTSFGSALRPCLGTDVRLPQPYGFASSGCLGLALAEDGWGLANLRLVTLPPYWHTAGSACAHAGWLQPHDTRFAVVWSSLWQSLLWTQATQEGSASHAPI
jgi:hypothetical protein